MYRISLINMPFASLSLPSIALTQLRSVVENQLGDRSRVRVHYFNHDFAHFLGEDVYELMSGLIATNAGLGDWFFRRAAFPDLDDNTESYFERYLPYFQHHFPQHATTVHLLRDRIIERREALGAYLEELIETHDLADDNLAGFTSMFSQNVGSFALARHLKTRRPEITTVIGGANCEAGMGREIARHATMIDFVFSGPGLVSFPTFVEYQINDTQDACHQINGVFSRQNCDDSSGSGRGVIGDELSIDISVPLDYEPFLASLAEKFPANNIPPYLAFETSRGCWWGERSHCTFCGLNGGTMAYRSMPSDMALDLLRELIDRYGDRCSRFDSVDNIMPREYLREVFPKLETPEGVSFFYEVKADLKEKEMAVLGQAGVTSIQPGIEALNTGTLKLMRKGTTAFQNLAFLKHCVLYGIQPMWNLLIGFPGEEPDVYEKYLRDLPLLPHLPPPAGAFPVRFDRFSPYFTQADAYGLKLEPFDFYSFVYPFGGEAIENMAYYFEDRNYRAEYLSHLAGWQQKLTAATEAWQKRWHARDGQPKAQLLLQRRGDVGTVIDSRSGRRIEIPLEPLALKILDATYLRGWKVQNIASQVKADELDVEDEVLNLQGFGLLFEENDRFMSLVLDEERRAAMDLTADAASLPTEPPKTRLTVL